MDGGWESRARGGDLTLGREGIRQCSCVKRAVSSWLRQGVKEVLLHSQISWPILD